MSKKSRSSAKRTKAKEAVTQEKLSAIDAAAVVLSAASEPMNCKEMVEAMSDQGLWESPCGKTPSATLYSAIFREIGAKGRKARFKRVGRGRFVARAV